MPGPMQIRSGLRTIADVGGSAPTAHWISAELATITGNADELIGRPELLRIAELLDAPAAGSMQLPTSANARHVRELAVSGATPQHDWAARVVVDDLRRWGRHAELEASPDIDWAVRQVTEVAELPDAEITPGHLRFVESVLTHSRVNETWLRSVPIGDAIIAVAERQVPTTGENARNLVDAIRAAAGVQRSAPVPSSTTIAASSPEEATLLLLARTGDRPRGQDLYELSQLARQLRNADGTGLSPGVANVLEAASRPAAAEAFEAFLPTYVADIRDLASTHPSIDRAARIERAATAIGAGEAVGDDLDRMLLKAASRQELDDIGLADRTRFNVDAWFVAQSLVDTTPGGARRTLVRARDLLDRMGPAVTRDATRSIADDTRDLIDRNLARIDGSIVDDINEGYLSHPDYAEVGRVQARIGMLRQLGAESSPTVHPAESAETLAW